MEALSFPLPSFLLILNRRMRIQFISKTSTSLFSTFTSTSISNSQSTCRLPTSTLTLLRSFNSTSLTFGMSAAPYKSIATDKAPSAIGPYVQATVHNGTVYCSGCIPFVPETMTCIEGGVEAQAEQALKNLFNVLEASGSDKSHVLKVSERNQSSQKRTSWAAWVVWRCSNEWKTCEVEL